MKQRRLYIVLLGLFIGYAHPILAEPWLIAADDKFPPYSFREDETMQGIHTDIIVATLKEMNQEYKIKAVPWTRVMKMTDDEKAEVERIVNDQIRAALPVSFDEITVEEAKAKGAIGLFESKYGEKVKVYTIGEEDKGTVFSMEICGGPHVKNTSELGGFKIKKEESSSSGVRRIKAVLEG